MNTSTTNKPASILRDGTLSATIWCNPTEKGNRYSVNLSRVYTDKEGNLRDSTSFSGSELLRVARLAQHAYDEILLTMQQDKKQADTAGS